VSAKGENREHKLKDKISQGIDWSPGPGDAAWHRKSVSTATPLTDTSGSAAAAEQSCHSSLVKIGKQVVGTEDIV